MGQRVPVVQHHPAIALALICRHDLGLDRHACPNLVLDGVIGTRWLPQEGVFGDFSLATSPFARRERCQEVGVAQHRTRLPKGADEVLTFGEIHPGLAANGSIDLGQQRRGDVHVGRASVIGGGGESSHVGDDPPTERDHHVGP